jgi:hypothetical protein
MAVPISCFRDSPFNFIKLPKLTRECCRIFFEESQLVSELHHRFGYNCLLIFVLGLKVRQRHFGSIFIGFEDGSESGDLFPFSREQALQSYDLLL